MQPYSSDTNYITVLLLLYCYCLVMIFVELWKQLCVWCCCSAHNWINIAADTTNTLGIVLIFWRNGAKNQHHEITVCLLYNINSSFYKRKIFPSFWIWSFTKKHGQFLVCITSLLVPSPRRLARTWLCLNRTALVFVLEFPIWLAQEKQERLRANGTYQLLPYVQRISLLGEKIECSTTKKITKSVFKWTEKIWSHTHLKQKARQDK